LSGRRRDSAFDKIRLTGGEPLLRRELEKLVALLAAIPGIDDLALTTNGFHFRHKAEALREAGLRRVSFSIDSLDRDNFKRITGRDGLGKSWKASGWPASWAFIPSRSMPW
jgi:cyclic pyranopterin phosphate synthase